MTAIVTRGNALNLHLPDETVDLVATSPPYFGLRSYQDGGEHYAGQVGDEATPTEYLDALIAATAEWQRVLKPGGSIFVNLGDKYASYEGNRGGGGTISSRIDPGRNTAAAGAGLTGGGFVKAKSLMFLPQRYAIRCIDELGLILRAEIVWAKPNGLPESVTDRVRRSHEQVFHFVKQPRYYSAVDEVRERTGDYKGSSWADRKASGLPVRAGQQTTASMGTVLAANPLGKLPGSVWSIPSAPLKVPDHLGVDHFAAYPPELVRRIILGWSPREVCTACGEGRRPVVDRPSPVGEVGLSIRDDEASGSKTFGATSQMRLSGGPRQRWKAANPDTLTGYACGCPDTAAPALPGVVLDPFGGTGTTALVASAYGRVGISVDLSADYCRLAKWRTSDPGERARVLGVPKPPEQVDGQLGMFPEGIGA